MTAAPNIVVAALDATGGGHRGPRSGSLRWYLDLRARLAELGYSEEYEWAQSVQPIADADLFWSEFAWVVLNSGMRNQVAEGIWRRVRPVVLAGGSAGSVFGHKGKAAAIDHVYANRQTLLAEYLAAPDKLVFLRALPWIGGITCWHLAKNYGHDCAKPDRHLVRIAGVEGTHAFCERLARESGDRIATVDLIIWRAANLRLPETQIVAENNPPDRSEGCGRGEGSVR